jgi:DNA-binding protein YbaB
MKITKSLLRKVIREEHSKVRKLNESPHAGKSVDEIAQFYFDKWETMRQQFSSIPPEVMSPEKIEAMVQTAAEDAIEQIKYEPEIAQEFYPHLSEEEIADLIARLEGGPTTAPAPPAQEPADPTYGGNFPMNESKKKITKLLLKKLIREALNEAQEPMTPDYVLRSLTNEKNVRTGEPFMADAMLGLEARDYRKVADAIMNALWIDDPPLGAEKELEDALAIAFMQASGGGGQVDVERTLADIGAQWGTQHFRTAPTPIEVSDDR